jgi:hypothetical protein
METEEAPVVAKLCCVLNSITDNAEMPLCAPCLDAILNSPEIWKLVEARVWATNQANSMQNAQQQSQFQGFGFGAAQSQLGQQLGGGLFGGLGF